MKTRILTIALIGAFGCFGITACGDDDPGDSPADDTGADTPTEDTSADTPTEDTPAEDTPTEDTPTEDTPTEDTPTEDTPTEDTPTEDTPTEDTPTEDTPTEDTYVFATNIPEDYSRVDRAGMPAVGTALIIDKDAYNAGGPPDDATLAFAGDLLASLGALHAALDDDLAGLGLTPCTVVGDGTGTCAAQGLPLIVPDTLKIDTTGVAGFPNGRGLEDSVIDITLAVILLDLGVHSVSLLADLPLGPAGNDVAFAADFPFLAPAH